MKGTPLGSGRRPRGTWAGAGAAALLLALGSAGEQALAAEIEVNRTAAKGAGTFAAAARRADSDKDRDVISFSRRLRGTIPVPRGLTFQHPVVIEGRGYGTPGSESFRRVVLKGPRRGASLHFDGLGGRGAVRDLYLDRLTLDASESRVDINRSYITGDSTVAGAGVYIVYNYDDRGVTHIGRSTITGFEKGVDLYRSDVKIDRSVVSANRGSGGVRVGGYSDAQITNSTISGNVSNGAGGGIRTGYESHIDVSNSTISGNVALGSDSYGGGVAGDVEVNESTITGNRAARGGGIANSYYYVATITNTIVAGNESLDPAEGEDCYDGHDGLSSNGDDLVRSNGGNLVQSPGSCSLRARDLSGLDPLLGPLADNGGPTPTYALRRGSPAIGLAVARTATARDQRGFRRDGDPDSGAFERRRPPAR